MSYYKMIQLARALKRATEDGSLRWERTAMEGVFQVAFPDYSIQIGTRPTDDAGGEMVFFTILNSKGEVVEVVDPGDLRPHIPSPYSFFDALYSAARRTAMGVDLAVDSLLQRLSGSPESNAPAEEEDGFPPPPPRINDDAPF